MTRLNYVDEMNERGQLPLAKVQEGDTVQFEAVFHKEGDEFTPSFSVDEGAIGTVSQIKPGMPGIMVKVHGTASGGGIRTEDQEVFVKPEDVVVLIDSRDPRIGTNRVEKEAKLAGMDVGLWDVVRAGLPAVAKGDFVSKAKASAALVAWARRIIHGEEDTAAHVASKIYAAIDSIDSMSEEEWATELSSQVGGISLT